MTTTTGSVTACPPSEVADAIKPWFEVYDGDLVLYDGQLHQVQQMWPLMIRGEFGVRLLREGETQDISVDSNSLVAVRRYITEEG